MKVQFIVERFGHRVGTMAEMDTSTAATLIKLGVVAKASDMEPKPKPIKEKIQNAAENSEKQNATI